MKENVEVQKPDDVEKKPPSFVYILGGVAAIGGFLFGYDTGVISAAMLYIPKEIPMNYEQKSLVVSITLLTCALFSLLGGVISNLIGRRLTILVSAIAFAAGSILLASSNSVAMLLTGRAIVGVGIGIASMTVPPYVAECSPYQIRGLMVVGFELMIVFGQFIASVTGGVLSGDWAHPESIGWRLMLGIAAIPAIIQLGIFIWIMPESPRWLVEHERNDQARCVLGKMYTTVEWRDYEQQQIEKQHREIQREIEVQQGTGGNWLTRSNIVMMLRIPHVRKAMFIGAGLQASQQLCGINTLMYFSAEIIRMSGIRSLSADIWMSCATSGANFFFTIIPILFIEKIGRRKLFLYSNTLVTFMLLFLGTGFLLINKSTYAVVDTFNSTDLYGLSPIEASRNALCSKKSSCDDCVTDQYCGFCILNTNSSYCLPVNLDYTSDYSWLGPCNQTSDYTWQYDYCDSPYSWMVLLGMMLYLMVFTSGMGPIPWVINAEIYPNWARATGASISTTSNWVCNFVVSETFLLLTEIIHKYGAFYVYAGISAISVVIFYFVLPETKGVPTEEVENLFRKDKTSPKS